MKIISVIFNALIVPIGIFGVYYCIKNNWSIPDSKLIFNFSVFLILLPLATVYCILEKSRKYVLSGFLILIHLIMAFLGVSMLKYNLVSFDENRVAMIFLLITLAANISSPIGILMRKKVNKSRLRTSF